MKQVLPGATLGFLGGGQLGRMLAVEARRMGYKTVCLDPVPGGPAAQVCDEEIVAAFDSPEALAIADKADLITLEWENIPAALAEKLAREKPVLPDPSVLAKIQDRLVQREFLKAARIPQTPFAGVDSISALEEAAERLRYPCILKRRRHGYDGKGQLSLSRREDLREAARPLIESPCVLEARVNFDKEISVILARNADGDVCYFPIAENVHTRGILHTSVAPAGISDKTAAHARHLAREIAKGLDHVGVMAVEMFAVGQRLLVNEIAPRVHNSGHYTLGACATSQFEQHLRAVCGLPFGKTDLLSPVVMVNLMGELWEDGEPRWDAALSPEIKLHFYGKSRPAPGRKMGHALILGETGFGLQKAQSLLAQLAPRRVLK